MSLLIFLLLVAVATVSGLSLISSRSTAGDSGELPANGARVWIRTSSPAAFDVVTGNWRSGDQVWDRFATNGGPGSYNPDTDTDGPDVWNGIECRYVSPAHFATPVFSGCYPGFSDNDTRLDTVDTDYVEGRELCVVSGITTYVKRQSPRNEDGNRPVVMNTFPVQVQTWAQNQDWERNALTMNLDSPPSDWPAGVVRFTQYMRGFDTQNVSVIRIPGLGAKFTVGAKYKVAAVITLQNNGLDTSVLQSYFNGGNPDIGDPFFLTLQTLALSVMQVGRVLVGFVDWQIYNPLLKNPVNPYRLHVSSQVVRAYLNPKCKFQMATQNVNLAPYALGNIVDGNVSPNVTDFCERNLKTCRDTDVQRYFPYGAVACPFPLASNSSLCSLKQFASEADCRTFFAALPDGQPSLGTGYSKNCRIYHLNIAGNAPQEHCIHTGALQLTAGMPNVPNFIHTPCF